MNTRVTAAAPDESCFFWRNGGKEKGPHTGLICNRIRNIIRQLPAEHHKYNRGQISHIECVSTELVGRAQLLKVLDASASEADQICKEMELCFPLYKLLLKEKKSGTEILEVFPHLQSYDGLLIKQFYERPEGLKLEDVLSQGLALAPTRFTTVEDDHIRGCLRIMSQLPIRGQKRTVAVSTSGVKNSERLSIKRVRFLGLS
ncbi:uncharacterized protein LOC129729311 [Wyeomyia smithii]|uniref:uncharacterized protein LOC129729311 n=1 Tax=Wyeomyia smithii TaxID=174621 RepID=UPI002467F585|nr:uncharacterized protein LOC129729311 [Wyeomyia smithii]